uniref:Regucalcin n=1 Tax=Anoplophora glabripennis TaxID=217634 RepID=V5GXT7_ANOGL
MYNSPKTDVKDKMVPHIERVVENCVFGEGPHWDEETQSLYFVDVMDKSICRYVPDTKKVTKANVGAMVSIIIPVKGEKDTFLIGRERELLIITWDGKSDKVSVLKKLKIESDLGTNFNDGKCDSKGRLWIGTVGKWSEDGTVEEERGSLYTIEKDKITKVADKITMSNGLDFNPALKKMFYIDSHKGTIDEFDFDIEQGTITNRRPVFTLSRHDIPGLLDGMTIDSDGNLWVAICNAGKVIKVDPRKPETLLYTLSLPAKQTTSVAFGGKNMDELYVTTGRLEFGNTEKLSVPENGAVYKITGLGSRGVRGESFAL